MAVAGTLEEIIIQKIAAEGPLSFRDFMEMCLYYPKLGYYNSQRSRIGREGDFYTSPVTGTVFGDLIGRQITEMCGMLPAGRFDIVEYGAGSGHLCRNILNYLRREHAVFDRINYYILDRSEGMREQSRTTLSSAPELIEKVTWCDSAGDIPEIRGCVISNELLDNFPVHCVVMDDELMEVHVDYRNGFVELLKPAADALHNYFSDLRVILPKGFRTEINLDADRWMAEVSSALNKGFVITIDYGFPSGELYSSYRRKGTILCYYRHSVNDNPYLHVGEQDITAHVNFSALCLHGYRHGLDFLGFTSQKNFLLSLGFQECLSEIAIPGNDYLNMRNEEKLTQQLLVGMGERMGVLIQSKGVQVEGLKGLGNSFAGPGKITA